MSLNKLRYLILLLGCLWAFPAFAQQQVEVSGTVTNAQTGKSIPAVNIVVRGTQTGTTTNSSGHYNLQVSSLKDTLVFSFIGYKSEIVPIRGRTEINVQLKSKTIMAEELVVVGYGTKEKENVTAAVSSVSAEDLENRPVTSVKNALAGTMSGVLVSQHSGQPGATQTKIRIRGIGTLNNSNPMVIVDGVVSSLSNVNSNDIASITVLKDAASAAIYGSRAANGVILIKTKEGQPGDIQMHYSGYVGKQKATRLPDFVPSWQAAKLYNQVLKNEGKAPIFSPEEIQKFKSGKYPDKYPNTDWLGLLYDSGSGIQQNHYLSISGGSKRTQYMFSLGYFDQKGLVKNTGNKKYTSRLSLNSEVIEDRLTVDAQFAYKRNNFVEPTNPYAGGFSQIIRQVNRISRMVPYKYSNGYYGYISDGNPIAWLNEGGNYTKNSHFFRASVQGDLKLLEGLHFKPSLGYQYKINRTKTFIKDIQYYNHKTGEPTFYQGPTQLTDHNNFMNVITLEALLKYKHSFLGKHNIAILGGYSQEYTRYSWLEGFRKDFLNNKLGQINLGSAAGQTTNGAERELALQSLFGRVSYDYKGKYMLVGSLRYDGSSRFAKGNRWGLFPSVSVGWNISSEDFFEPIKSWFSYLKIRGSWGKLGNQKLGAASPFINTVYPYIPTVNSGLIYTFNGATVTGIAPTSGANSDITWETTTQLDIGLDAGFLNGKITFTADYFIKKTTDILLSLPVSAMYGLDAPVKNAGAVRNKGWEFSVGYQDGFGDWSFDISGNTSFITNEITDLNGIGPIINGATFMKEGYPIHSFYGYKVEGIFQTEEQIKNNAEQTGGPIAPGDLNYKDLNGDGEIDGDDRTYLGTYTPKMTYGLNFGVNWKGVGLRVFIQGATNVKGFITGEILGQARLESGKPTSILLDAWTPDNRDASFPRLWYNYKQNDPATNPSSFWVRNASYMRLKNLKLSYTFPEKWVQQIGFESAKIYYSGQNLLTITPFYDWVDPQAPAGERGYTYPQVKVHTIGIDLTF